MQVPMRELEAREARCPTEADVRAEVQAEGLTWADSGAPVVDDTVATAAHNRTRARARLRAAFGVQDGAREEALVDRVVAGWDPFDAFERREAADEGEASAGSTSDVGSAG